MRVAIITNGGDLSAYVLEILKTWGLTIAEPVSPADAAALDSARTPVAVYPAGPEDSEGGESLVDYARRGGTVICCLPRGTLAAAGGLECEGDKEPPLRLRLTGFTAAGVDGELLPVVGSALTYQHSPDVQPLAYLSHPGRYEGESIGIAANNVGTGRIITFAFDLPLCVLMLRQGDPARAETIPAGDTCARPSHMAAALGPNDSAWMPFADLLGRLLVDLIIAHVPAPMPLIAHLPGRAAGIMLYSGDEDGAQVAWNDEELDYVAAAGARMSLYLIPIGTKSTKADVERYLEHNDVGPHPNLRRLDGQPVSARLEELDRQIRMFNEMFDVRARTVRNHSTNWAGYLEPIEVMARHGIRMDGSFFSGTYLRDREPGPYASFGGAMPMRFCQPDGALLDVFQQHTHLSDDAMFSQDAEYSHKILPAQFEVMLRRILTDVVTRFHSPYAVCIHPSNWVRFSRPQGQALLRQAEELSLPVWSFDQWLGFWEARDSWAVRNLEWDGSTLEARLEGDERHAGLGVYLPIQHGSQRLTALWVDGEPTPWEAATRWRSPVAIIPLAGTAASIKAEYR